MLSQLPVKMERTEMMAVRTWATMVSLINMFASVRSCVRARHKFCFVLTIMTAQIMKLEQTEMMLRTEQMVKMELMVKTWKTALMSVQTPE